MHWFSATDYWLGRFLFERALALIYLVAFVVALNQFRPLLGERGLLPAPALLRATRFRDTPSLFHLDYSDRLLVLVCWTGIVLALLTLSTLPQRAPLPVSMLVWFALWALYVSIVNIGQTFYSFGWESLLLETGFLAIFLGSGDMAPPVLIMWLLRWLLFRLEFGAGLIKLRGDACWRRLTCLDYHHETQPMPNPLSWYFHHLPAGVHRVEVLGNHAAQLMAPLLLFTPQPVAGVGAGIMIATQLWLVLSGNFSWLNALTIALGLSVFDDSWLRHVIPLATPVMHATPAWFIALVLAATALVALLSWWPVRNMVSRGQHMNASFNTLHLVNTYGAFGSVTKIRNEVVVEGTADLELTPNTLWKEYEFKGKPGDPRRRPPQIAPYHLRLDWLMWFIALAPSYGRSWFPVFMVRLLENDRAMLALLRTNPFAGQPPVFVRARLYRYHFTSAAERRETHEWWRRTPLGDYLPPVSLDRDAGTRAVSLRAQR
ncbi:MAG: lipase maturation factor family protein [Candidatus Dormibacteraeota bacterium]|nr:lipase maturation factor family protein [Candidatus Dormibacteraeota bacterium]